MKTIKKSIICLITSILLIISALLPKEVVKAASSTVYFETDETTLTVGNTISIYLCVDSDVTLGDFEGFISYNADIIEYVSGASCITGGDGVLKVYDYGASTTNTRKYILNFKIIDVGSSELNVTEAVAYEYESGDAMSLSSTPLKINTTAPKTASENAQRYFSKYQKAKNAVNIVKEQIEITYEELSYFELLLQQVETASPNDIEEIREELVEGGYLKARHKKLQKKSHNTKPILDEYISTDGTSILVGKNNKQNDYLTNKLAARDEIWLHTKDIPGSHVVIRSKEPSEQTIFEAAALAAYYSKGKNSTKVPIDYTEVRNVKKMAKGKPGMVTYSTNKTIYVDPVKLELKEV